MDVAEIIDALGGAAKISAKIESVTGTPYARNSVYWWKYRGTIPPEVWPPLLDLAVETGVREVTAATLAAHWRPRNRPGAAGPSGEPDSPKRFGLRRLLRKTAEGETRSFSIRPGVSPLREREVLMAAALPVWGKGRCRAVIDGDKIHLTRLPAGATNGPQPSCAVERAA